MDSEVKIWTISSLEDDIIGGILKGSVVDTVSKERISKRFGIVSRAIVAQKKTLRITPSQALMFGSEELSRKMKTLRRIVFHGSVEGINPVHLGGRLARSFPNIVSIQYDDFYLCKFSLPPVIDSTAIEYVRASYNNDKSYTGSNLEIAFHPKTADLLTVQCPGLNLETKIKLSDAALDKMARCRWFVLNKAFAVVANGPHPSVKIISIGRSFSRLESLRSFPNLEHVGCQFSQRMDLYQFLPPTVKVLSGLIMTIGNQHVSMLNSLLDNSNIASVFLRVFEPDIEPQLFQKFLYALIRTRNQSLRTFVMPYFVMMGRNMRVDIKPATPSLVKFGFELMPWIGLIPLLLDRFKRIKYLEIVLPQGNIDDLETEGCVMFFDMLRKMAERNKLLCIKVKREVAGAVPQEILRF